MSELANRLGYLSRINLAVITRNTTAPGGAPVSISSAIAMALAVTAAAIEAGEVGRFLSSGEGAWTPKPASVAVLGN